jgi:hypothetical protein
LLLDQCVWILFDLLTRLERWRQNRISASARFPVVPCQSTTPALASDELVEPAQLEEPENSRTSDLVPNQIRPAEEVIQSVSAQQMN